MVDCLLTAAQRQPARTTAAYASLSHDSLVKERNTIPRQRVNAPAESTRPQRPEGEGDLILMLSEEPRAVLNSMSAEARGSCRDRRLGIDQPPSYGISIP